MGKLFTKFPRSCTFTLLHSVDMPSPWFLCGVHLVAGMVDDAQDFAHLPTTSVFFILSTILRESLTTFNSAVIGIVVSPRKIVSVKRGNDVSWLIRGQTTTPTVSMRTVDQLLGFHKDSKDGSVVLRVIRSVSMFQEKESNVVSDSVFDRDHRPLWFSEEATDGAARLKPDPVLLRAFVMRGSRDRFSVFEKHIEEVAAILDLKFAEISLFKN